MLLDRDAVPRAGWWARIFGPSCTELCDPQDPIRLEPLRDEQTAMSILRDAVHLSSELDSDAAEAVLEEIRNSPHEAELIGNPLLLQIAAGSYAAIS